jgi:hypothetical protein
MNTNLMAAEEGIRLGDRVCFRVTSAHKHAMTGDVIGFSQNPETGVFDKLLVGWADKSQSFELPIELRKVAA